MYHNLSRNSNIERLRIIAMLLIVIHHFVMHGVLNDFNGNFFNGSFFNANIFTAQILLAGGKIGVDIFVLITGYFLCISKFKSQRIIKILFQTWCYSVMLFIAYLLFSGAPISPIMVLKSLFPISYNVYWFISCYVLLILFSPVINLIMRYLSEQALLATIVVILMISFVMPHFKMTFADDDIIRFIGMYLLGAAIQLNKIPNLIKRHTSLWLSLCILAMLLSIVLFDVIGLITNHAILIKNAAYLCMENYSIFSLVSAFLILLNATKQAPKSNFLINRIASLMFGVYLLHDNEFFAPILWHKLLHTSALINVSLWVFFLNAILIILGVFMLGIVVEFIRSKCLRTIEQLILRLFETSTNKLNYIFGDI